MRPVTSRGEAVGVLDGVSWRSDGLR
jgi:hypothetical protein